MDIFANFLHYGISFVIIISLIVFVHEWGHFFIARKCGVKVEEFSIGFGKELFGWVDKKGTRWKICVLPFGGFVKMYGDSSEYSGADKSKLKKMSKKQKEVSFHFKPLWQKAAVVAAGPLVNFLFAILIYTSIFTLHGKLNLNAPAVVFELVEGGAAEKIGMKPGDKVVELDGKPIKYFTDLQEVIRVSVEEEMPIKYLRDGKEIAAAITPEVKEIDDGNGNKVRFGMIGIKRAPLEITEEKLVRLSLPEAISEAVVKVYKDCRMMLKGMGQIITGQRSSKELGGPIKILEYSGQSTDKISKSISCMAHGGSDCGQMAGDGLLISLIFMAMISTMLGLMNLLPIPVLDGGHLMLYLLEAIFRRPVAEKVQEYAFRVGFALLIMLMAFASFNDVVSFAERYFGS